MHLRIAVERDERNLMRKTRLSFSVSDDGRNFFGAGFLHFTKEEAVTFLECFNPANVPLMETFAVTNVEVNNV